MRFIDPRIDFAFRKIFGSEDTKDILISFLESLLRLEGERRLQEVTLLDPFLAPRIQGMKDSVLDVRCLDHRGVHYIVEMQVQKVQGYLKRHIPFNAAKVNEYQTASVLDYPKQDQMIAVTIIDFPLFSEFSHYVSCHEMRETISGQSLLVDILYYFIELSKFDKPLAELEDPLDQWIFFIKFASSLEEIPAKLPKKPFRRAFKKARLAWMDRDELDLYDRACMAVADRRGALELARQEGKQEGKQEGAAMLLQLAQHRFGPLPVDVRQKIENADSAQLATWGNKLLDGHSLTDIST